VFIRYLHIFLSLLILKAFELQAQHYQFSQFYAAPTYISPAFTGANACARLTMNYREQWSGIPGAFSSYQASFDHYFQKIKSGVGIQFFKDKAGLANLQSTQVNMLYAYEVKLSKLFVGRGGINFGMVQRSINSSAFVFGDQIARGGSGSSVENLAQGTVNYFDMGFGFLGYSKDAWFGFSANHINQPNQSLLGETSKLPAELKMHGGYRFVLDNKGGDKTIATSNFITAAINYKRQANFNQLDLGLYYSKSMIVMGLWYRGIPFFKVDRKYTTTDAMVYLIGISFDKYKFGYSYDMTISKLSNFYSKGAHEISMSIQFCNMKKTQSKRNLLQVYCPKF
jgi:type IX secretion system PorP/SprF family membrane protein